MDRFDVGRDNETSWQQGRLLRYPLLDLRSCGVWV
jgi:hypothetical protein